MKPRAIYQAVLALAILMSAASSASENAICIGVDQSSISEIRDVAVKELRTHLALVYDGSVVKERIDKCEDGIRLDVIPSKLSAQEFRIRDSHGLINISGGSAKGLLYAVYDFIEKDLGIHWLFPGSLGMYVPGEKLNKISAINRQKSPDFRERLISGNLFKSENPDYAIWRRRVRLADTDMKFHHNLKVLDGKRFKRRRTREIVQNLPSQPNIEDQAYSNFVVREATRTLGKTDEKWFSIGISDSAGWRPQ